MKAYQEAEQDQQVEGAKEIEDDQANQGTDAIFGDAGRDQSQQHEEPHQDYQPPDLGMFGGEPSHQQGMDQPFPADASFPIGDAYPTGGDQGHQQGGDLGFQTGGDMGFQQGADMGFQQGAPENTFDQAFGGAPPMAQDQQGTFWNQGEGQAPAGMWNESGLPSDIVKYILSIGPTRAGSVHGDRAVEPRTEQKAVRERFRRISYNLRKKKSSKRGAEEVA